MTHLLEGKRKVYFNGIFEEFSFLTQAQELSQCLGIPLSCVIPVKNYCEELEPNQDTDIMLLMALKQMLNYSDSFFENQQIYEEGEASCQQQDDCSFEPIRPSF